MPALPTFTVSDEQATRLLAAFGSVDNYLAWLREQLIARVIETEMRDFRKNMQTAHDTRRQELIDSLQ